LIPGLWNTKTRSKEADVIPVPGAQTITDLVTAKNGIIYGIAAPDNVYTLFAYDPAAHKIISQKPLPFHSLVYNGIGVTSDGKIVGLAEDEIFTIDKISNDIRVIAKSPMKITGGFALHDGAVYFTSNSKVYRYHLAESQAHHLRERSEFR
jgi:hypothetical protein